MKTTILLSFLSLGLSSCLLLDNSSSQETSEAPIAQQVLEQSEILRQSAENYREVAVLDHHKMAAEEGVYTPPAILHLYSDPEINTPLIKINPRTGLDLPLKVLIYSEPDTNEVFVAETSGAFLCLRHDVPFEAANDHNAALESLLDSTGLEPRETDLDSVGLNFGIVELQSDYNFDTTVAQLKAIVNAQSDTRWFGEVDYRADALALGDSIQPCTLLLFGGPAPGGKAMMTTPRIGLDAFCQKLLVYEAEDGHVHVIYNDIPAFAQLYYGLQTKPQELIRQRLEATFTSAITRNTEE
ncbi:DUF302 domain-containing protein [Cryomorphaceae bacterium]|nr:DUF302 domain-containing protein [Cryomorphaceae bacterium]